MKYVGWYILLTILIYTLILTSGCSLGNGNISKKKAIEICELELMARGIDPKKRFIEITTDPMPLDSLKKEMTANKIDSVTEEGFNKMIKKLENKIYWIASCCTEKDPPWGKCVHIYLDPETGDVLWYDPL